MSIDVAFLSINIKLLLKFLKHRMKCRVLITWMVGGREKGSKYIVLQN